MRSATRVTVSTFGVLAGIAGLEHGIGEVLQGNVAPDGMVIESWRGTELFDILAGEPAMTLIPNLLVTGILAIFTSLILLVWVTKYVQRQHGGLVLILISAVLILVGGGFGPPVLGTILGVTATRINAPLNWWRAHLSAGARRFLGALWPWSFGAGLAAWLFLFPGSLIVDYFVGANNPDRVEATVAVAVLAAFGLLFVTIIAGFARDAERRTGVVKSHSFGR